MNQTNFEHLGVALAFQAIIAAVTGDWWLGALFAIGIFGGREHAQREYHIGDPSKLIGYEALDFWRWKLDAQLDFLFPAVGVTIVAMVI